ncbi:MAG: phosphotransacetylase family protein, partial [Chloroflexota bacterium]
EPWELSPVIVTPEYLREHLGNYPDVEQNFMKKIRATVESFSADTDVLLLEGGASLREGYVVGLPTVSVAAELGSAVIVIVRYRDDVSILDDALAAQKRLDRALTGVLINRVPKEAINFVEYYAAPHLEKLGVPVYGILPETPSLAALNVSDLVGVLEAEVLTRRASTNQMIEALTVGAMTAEAALSRFRKQTRKAVITGGDRTDIQLAALETSTSCLVLTGNLRPSPLVIKQAEEFGIPVLLVRQNTMETIEKIERIFGKTRLGQPGKLNQFKELLAKHFNYARLYEALEVK